ncbi:M61 family peptidase [Brumimicrobium glaciale]|uniref:M61 family peptidase n=1 Tax=Brumimicrobium glaciale TaxID=200475 RepID=A0A4Q4KEA5_9FLAO|nr:M61 family metallopeptidase [Brumimicrobium glaciale]RYM30777.1 M61 family peptidase [Brumimicrobium glaciale]
MKFTFDIKSPQQQYIQITAEIKATGKETTVYFPAWRPGRYELGDFAKNVNHFQIFNGDGSALKYQKANKNTWIVQTEGCKTITVKYSYYATDLNAGSTFLDASQLYVNPVNCCLFTDESYNDPITVILNIPKSWKVAHSLKVKENSFTAANYDELADSPFICSAQLQKSTYEVDGTTFYIWFNGIVKPDWKRLENDFKAFTESQIKAFSKFPTDEYHFLIQILPYQTYHGVEHSKSTVITLGPSYAVFEEMYKELLGVSSHELYHTWNVKSIRPSEMVPYNFKKENYSELGYIAEGVTTYMGDLMLFKSGVFNLDQYLLEMNKQIQKHMDNFGRFNYSVADSSFDTWLDGYVAGAPGRKVSIYTEGCLLAFILDIQLLKYTDNQKNLDDVMRSMYLNFGARGKGVTEKDYQNEIEKLTGVSMQWYFDDYVHGTKAYTTLLIDCLEYIGIEYKNEPVESDFGAYLGAKIMEVNNETVIAALYPGGALDISGAMIGDKVISINEMAITNNADRWAKFYRREDKEIVINRKGALVNLHLTASKNEYYQRYFLKPAPSLDKDHIDAFDVWRNV